MGSWQSTGKRNAEFFYELALEYQKDNSDQYDAPSREEDSCVYHDHVAKGTACYMTRL